MSQPEKPAPDQPRQTDDANARRRKPYQKPAFSREQLFETMALACGKTNPVIGQCKLVKKNS